MEHKNEVTMNNTPIVFTIISWIFGIVVFAAGLINIIWGNDQGFGVFLVLLSFIYFLPVNEILNKMFGFTIPRMTLIKVLLGAFIIWAVLGVGELFDKVDMMKTGL